MKIVIELDSDDLKKMAASLNNTFSSLPEDVKTQFMVMLVQASERIGYLAGKARPVDIPEGVTPEEEKANKKDAPDREEP